MTRTLVVTNDFPPRPGGIQSFVHALASRLPSVTVLTSRWRGWEEYDAAQPFPVVRADTSVLLPTPAVLRQAREIARADACDSVWFGAAAPLGLLAPRLGLDRSVASTHGHEVGWALLPGTRQLLRQVARGVDVMTYLNGFTRSRLAPALGRYAERLQQLASGVDTDFFAPGCGGDDVRRRLGLSDRPVVVCVSRLVPRKGQDVLVRALPLIRRRVPDACLLLVGGGPYRKRLQQMAGDLPVVVTGSVPWAQLPAYYDAGDVFAMPCRDRLGGIEVEGLGIVFLEASAVGLPVVAGRSGGSPDAVLDGQTGHVVDGRSVADVADRICALLLDRPAAHLMGARGRAWVQQQWQWPVQARRLQQMLHPGAAAAG